MKYFDLHCDTIICCAWDFKKHSLYSNDFRVSFDKMKKGGAIAQFFAVFVVSDKPDGDLIWLDEVVRANNLKCENDKDSKEIAMLKACFEYFSSEIEKHKNEVGFAKSYKDVLQNDLEGKISALLSIEDGRTINGSHERLDWFYENGVRLMNLTWNWENCFGYPNSKDSKIMAQGLKEFGFEAVEHMNKLGMIIDVSHLSDGGFWDICVASKKPFIASHSNSRELCAHQRNLTDEMIKKLAELGGVTGLNYGGYFLNADISNRDSMVSRMADHIQHIVNIGGIDVMALGSDLDGVSCKLEIGDVSQTPKLFVELEKRGFTTLQIEKIAYKNFMRVFSEQ